MKKIETGIDKLVGIVEKEKKIELSKAAKELGVPEEVVQEWADFLEEEGLLSITYKLSKTYLEERKLSKKEVEKKAKEYNSKKEAFTRKVDTTLKQLEKETAGFEEIKKQYYSLKEEIGDEINQVKDEVQELRHYEDLKKSIDRDILQQKVDYENSLGDIHKRITAEEKRYGKIQEEIAKEAKKISDEAKDMHELKQQEDTLGKRLDALKEIMDGVKTQVSEEDENIKHHEERLKQLKKLADSMEKEIKGKRENEIQPLVESSSKHQEKILKVQDDIVKKIRARKEQIESYETQGEQIAKRFEKFFKKKADTEKIVKDLEKQKADMKADLNDLIKKARAFDLTSKKDSSKHIKELEKKMNEYDKKHSSFAKRLEDLRKVISGR